MKRLSRLSTRPSGSILSMPMPGLIWLMHSLTWISKEKAVKKRAVKVLTLRFGFCYLVESCYL